VVKEIADKMIELCLLAKKYDINLCVDAEESERLDISFDIIERIFSDPRLDGWEGFGLALQAYQKRAFYAIDWLAALAKKHGRRLMLRLVKGAYWDSEVKRAQERGLDNYAVFTRKATTDVSFLACAKKILSYGADIFYPQFGTHNAYTVASILQMAGGRDFEFQRLHGMAEELYAEITGAQYSRNCRVYAPVGSHEDLLAYLVRRLLENGANSSFVHRIVDPTVPIDSLIQDPVAYVDSLNQKKHPNIPLPPDLFGAERKNSKGLDLSNLLLLDDLLPKLEKISGALHTARPIISGIEITGTETAVFNPANHNQKIGTVTEAGEGDVEKAVTAAHEFFPEWNATSVSARAACLERAADLLEEHMPALMALAITEAGKTIGDAVAEVREAVDFCRYYASQAKKDFMPIALPGPTGEQNQLRLAGRGVFICISPWNFPLAIFLGQITAALAAGNTVVAKPAEQTPLIACKAIQLLHRAGIPEKALHILPGRGETVGAALVEHSKIAGVCFTGGNDTARQINRTLASRQKQILPFIAETGGQNAIIVDSSALPEQVVSDVIASAFQSAGQRCSALRVLYLQDEVYDKTIHMLIGAMQELKLGDPLQFANDIGPLIDKQAINSLAGHVDLMRQTDRILYEMPNPDRNRDGSFFPPTMIALNSIRELEREFFGPVLHVIRFKAHDLSKVIAEINDTGYGLTFGIHSRIEDSVNEVVSQMHAGNIYVNRNIIGAVVGVQPFGGQGLSGTGPKAGGPHYLHRFATEKTITVDTTAAGGNASLLCLSEDEI
jgi:RHH-type proline utilization regulon transcriptional repressor/proline dehydrogenase/delta 1-pyrroline-5-carboxylate dehydrogenase